MSKIAIFHDYFDEIGGAEITILTMARGLKATVFTTNIDWPTILQLGFTDVKIISIGHVPHLPHWKQLVTQLKFSFLKLTGFDLYIFGGSLCIYAARSHKPNIWYCFSPQRGLYDLRYFRKTLTLPWKDIIKGILIGFDKKTIAQVQKIIACSNEVNQRLKKYYGRAGEEVVYFPVRMEEFKYLPSSNYWLSVQRIDPYKNIELQIEIFRTIKDETLLIVGGASKEFSQYFHNLQAKAPTNVKFIGPVFKRNELADLYAKSKGFIATSKNEDFGISAVEAMASGKPVIALNEGGYKETVVDGVTGRLIADLNPDQWIMAIREIGQNPGQYKDACRQYARQFDTSIFLEKIKQNIQENHSVNVDCEDLATQGANLAG